MFRTASDVVVVLRVALRQNIRKNFINEFRINVENSCKHIRIEEFSNKIGQFSKSLRDVQGVHVDEVVVEGDDADHSQLSAEEGRVGGDPDTIGSEKANKIDMYGKLYVFELYMDWMLA